MNHEPRPEGDPPLFHWTGTAAAAAIGEEGTLYPMMSFVRYDGYPAWVRSVGALVWLTDLDGPMTAELRDALGLTCELIATDRTRVRYRRDRRRRDRGVRRWVDVRADFPAGVRRALEVDPVVSVRPLHWWVSTGPVPVVRSVPAVLPDSFALRSGIGSRSSR